MMESVSIGFLLLDNVYKTKTLITLVNVNTTTGPMS